jgi:hypothetical protein
MEEITSHMRPVFGNNLLVFSVSLSRGSLVTLILVSLVSTKLSLSICIGEIYISKKIKILQEKKY